MDNQYKHINKHDHQLGGVHMAKREKKEFTCTMEFTEGAIDRITDAFVDLYYQIKQGIYSGPPFPAPDTKDETA